jgi:hypothetical protein
VVVATVEPGRGRGGVFAEVGEDGGGGGREKGERKKLVVAGASWSSSEP